MSKLNYFKTIQYSVKAICRNCKKQFHDVINWDFGSWSDGDGGRYTKQSYGLEEQMNIRYKCCGELVVFYSKQLTNDSPNK